MTPEEHYISAMSALELPETEQREFVAEFRRSLIEHDMRVLEDFLYGSDTYRPSAAEWANGYKAGLGDDSAGVAVLQDEIPAFADTSTCSRCAEEYPTDELYDEWCEACLRVGGSE